MSVVSIPSPTISELGEFQMADFTEIPIKAKVFALLVQGIKAQGRRELPVANKLTEIALRLADEMPAGEANGFRALGLCLQTLIRLKEDRQDEAAELRLKATELVDRLSDLEQ